MKAKLVVLCLATHLICSGPAYALTTLPCLSAAEMVFDDASLVDWSDFTGKRLFASVASDNDHAVRNYLSLQSTAALMDAGKPKQDLRSGNFTDDRSKQFSFLKFDANGLPFVAASWIQRESKFSGPEGSLPQLAGTKTAKIAASADAPDHPDEPATSLLMGMAILAFHFTTKRILKKTEPFSGYGFNRRKRSI